MSTASDTVIRRHVKIKSTANPFDPKDEIYFENRLDWKLNESPAGRKKLARLWVSQEMRCPVCQQPLEANGKWNVHYSRLRSEGGTDNLANQSMVHPDCHRRIHSQHLHVVKPASIEA